MSARAAAKKRPVRESVRREARGAFRDAILAAAERVFTRGGFYAARMADVADEAGVGVGTLYNYFESKEVIFSAILERHHGELRERIERAGQSRDALERLSGTVRAVFEYVEEHGSLLHVLLERGGVGELDMERLAGPNAARHYEDILALLGRHVRAAMRAKLLRSDMDPHLVVAVLSGAMNGATYAWFKSGRRGRLSAGTDALFGLFLQGARHP